MYQLDFCDRKLTQGNSLEDLETYIDRERFLSVPELSEAQQELLAQGVTTPGYFIHALDNPSQTISYFDVQFLEIIIEQGHPTRPPQVTVWHNQQLVSWSDDFMACWSKIPSKYLPAEAVANYWKAPWRDGEKKATDGYRVKVTLPSDDPTGERFLTYRFFHKFKQPRDEAPKFSAELRPQPMGDPLLLIHHNHQPRFTVQPMVSSGKGMPALPDHILKGNRSNGLFLLPTQDGEITLQLIEGSLSSAEDVRFQLMDFYHQLIGVPIGIAERFRVYHNEDQIALEVRYQSALTHVPEGYIQEGSGAFSDWKVPPSKLTADYYRIERECVDGSWEPVAIFFEHLHRTGYPDWDSAVPLYYAIDRGLNNEYFSDFSDALESLPSHLISVCDTEEGQALGLSHDQEIPGKAPDVTIQAIVGPYEISPLIIDYHYYE